MNENKKDKETEKNNNREKTVWNGATNSYTTVDNMSALSLEIQD